MQLSLIFSSTSAVDQRIDHIQYRFQIGKDADAYRRMSDSKESDWEVWIFHAMRAFLAHLSTIELKEWNQPLQ